MTRIALFIIFTLFFLRISWKSLANPGTHGFYRFFVFEGVLLLLLMNHKYWFHDPFSTLHLLSWFLLLASIFFIVQSLLMLKREGGHGARHEMPENFSFENTVNVVEQGLYKYVRHPMYSSLLFLAWGTFLKHINAVNIALIFMISFFLITSAKVEEQENIRFFGPKYKEYMQRTKMFIPYLF